MWVGGGGGLTESNGVFTPEQDNDKTRSDKPGVKGIIEMHRFNICLVVVLSLSCFGVKTLLALLVLYCERFLS